MIQLVIIKWLVYMESLVSDSWDYGRHFTGIIPFSPCSSCIRCIPLSPSLGKVMEWPVIKLRTYYYILVCRFESLIHRTRTLAFSCDAEKWWIKVRMASTVGLVTFPTFYIQFVYILFAYVHWFNSICWLLRILVEEDLNSWVMLIVLFFLSFPW